MKNSRMKMRMRMRMRMNHDKKICIANNMFKTLIRAKLSDLQPYNYNSDKNISLAQIKVLIK